MLIGNFSVLQKTPGRYLAGSTTSVESQLRSNFGKNGMMRNRLYPSSGSEAYHYHSLPGGYNGQYTYMLPQSAGGLGSINQLVGSGSFVSASMRAIVPISSSMSGTGSFTASGMMMPNVLSQIVDTSYNLQQTLQLILAATAGKVSGSEGTTITFRNPDDTKNRIVAIVDASGNRTAITYDNT